MELYFSKEAANFLFTLLGGTVLGMVLDIFRVIKKLSQKSVVFYTVCDISVWIILSLISFGTIFVSNNGQIRWYEIFALILGFIIYTIALSKYFVEAVEFLIRVLFIVIKIVLKPFSFIFSILKRIFVCVLNWLKSQKNKLNFMKNKQKLNFRQINRIFRKN